MTNQTNWSPNANNTSAFVQGSRQPHLGQTSRSRSQIDDQESQFDPHEPNVMPPSREESVMPEMAQSARWQASAFYWMNRCLVAENAVRAMQVQATQGDDTVELVSGQTTIASSFSMGFNPGPSHTQESTLGHMPVQTLTTSTSMPSIPGNDMSSVQLDDIPLLVPMTNEPQPAMGWDGILQQPHLLDAPIPELMTPMVPTDVISRRVEGDSAAPMMLPEHIQPTGPYALQPERAPSPTAPGYVTGAMLQQPQFDPPPHQMVSRHLPSGAPWDGTFVPPQILLNSVPLPAALDSLTPRAP